MKELHALVDFENVQPTLAELAKLAPGFTDVWLFHGPHQTKQAQQLADAHSRVTLVPRSGKGKNALDFHLSFYLGYVAAKHPLAELVVVANDKGYDPMIAHARLLGFTAKRVGYKAKPAPAKKAASPVAPAKAVAKKVPAKKVAATTVPAVKTSTPKTPAKKAAAKKAVPKQAAAKKVAPKPPAKKAPKPAKAKPIAAIPAAPPSPEARTLARIQKGLIKMGSKAPTKLKPFLRHIGALLGKDSTAEQIDAVVAKLEAVNTVRVTGDAVSYSVKR